MTVLELEQSDVAIGLTEQGVCTRFNYTKQII